MEIPFNLLVVYLGISMTIFFAGLLMAFRKIDGAPFFCVFAGIMVIGQLAITEDIQGEGLTGNSTQQILPLTTTYMNQQTTSGVSVLRAGANTFFGETVVNENSQLYGKTINQVQVRLDKNGSPPSDLYVGVWNAIVNPSSTNAKFIIGQMKANMTNPTQMIYLFTRNDTTTYTLGVDDSVGVFYNNGDASNLINIGSNATASSFDGSNSVRSLFNSATNTWTHTTTSDLTGRISLIEDIAIEEHEPYQFNQIDTYVYSIILGSFFIFIGVMLQLRDWK